MKGSNEAEAGPLVKMSDFSNGKATCGCDSAMSGSESQRHKLLGVISRSQSKSLIVGFLCACVRGEREKQEDRETAAKKRQDMRDTQLQDVERLKMLPSES